MFARFFSVRRVKSVANSSDFQDTSKRFASLLIADKASLPEYLF